MANHCRVILGDFVGNQQIAFISGRMIGDNILFSPGALEKLP
jgi:hypothetical protein